MKNRKSSLSQQRLSLPKILLWLLVIIALLSFFGLLSLSWAQATEAAPNTSSATCTDATDPQTCEATDLINSLLNFLAIITIPLIVILIIVGGIQYSMAGANPEALKAAQGRIAKAILALICFIGLWGFLKWLLPGGLG